MSRRPWLSLKLRTLFDRRRLGRELADELAAHVEMETEAGVARGLSPREARRRALASFGGVERIREETRDQWSFRWLDDLVLDLRHAARSFAHSPLFTLVAVATLALGIGAATSIFSVLDAVLWTPPPFSEPERLAMVWETDRATGTVREPASVPDFLDLEARSRRFDELAAFQGRQVTLTAPEGQPRRLAALAVTQDFLGMAGVAPRLGRGFEPADDRPGAAPVAWLGEHLWRTGYGGEAGIVGRRVEFDGVPHTVAGVIPAEADFGFRQILGRAAYQRSFGEGGSERVAVWLPLAPDPEASPRQTHPIFVLGRLAPGANARQAQEEVDSIMAELEREYPENLHRGAFVEPLADVVLEPVRPALWLLLGVVALVLLIAWVNVASLLLARSAARSQEVAVRTALGAGTRRLARQFLVEGLLLASLAGVLGIGVAALALPPLLTLVPQELAPRLGEVGLDGGVLLASLAVVASVGLAFGAVPWLEARRGGPFGALSGGSARGATAGPAAARLRGALVVAELALAVTLVVGAGLLVRSFLHVTAVDLGFDTAQVLKAEVQLPASRYPRDFATWPDWPEIQGFHEAVLTRVRALPGVERAALAGAHPLAAGFTNSFVIEGREGEAAGQPEIAIRQVSPGYFRTVGVAVAAGRPFTEADTKDSVPVAAINLAAARRFFPEDEPLGQRIGIWGVFREIVAVVGDERFHGPEAETAPAVYLPQRQAPAWNLSLLARTDEDPAQLAASVRAAVHEVDPALAVFGLETLDSAFARTVAKPRLLATLVGLFAAVALLLALVGIHGVLAYTVAQRRREMGIRMALGAARGDVVGLVFRDGLRFTLLGLALGLLCALALSRSVDSLLFEVRPTDPTTLAVVAGSVLTTALLASLLPALQATRVDPARTLQGE